MVNTPYIFDVGDVDVDVDDVDFVDVDDVVVVDDDDDDVSGWVPRAK